MGWRDKMKEWGGGDITFLSSDGECMMFVVVDEPVLLHGTFKKNPQDRIGCPIVTDEGFLLFVTGKRVARKLSKFEQRFKDTAFLVTRHGVSEDKETTYDVSVLNNPEKTKQLLEIAKREYKPALLKEAIEAANEVMST